MATVCALSTTAKGSCLDVVAGEVLKHVKENTIDEFKRASKCQTDECVIDRAVKDSQQAEKIRALAFKVPTQSVEHNYWMNNTEIDSVMLQLRSHYPGFAHSFIHMIDLKSFPPANTNVFDYPVRPLSEINFANEFKLAVLNQKPQQLSTANDAPVRSFGVVCNTDSSKGSGQHWFAVYISMDNKMPNDSKPWIRIELFNSAGGKPGDKLFNQYWETQALEIARATGCTCTYDEITNIQHQSPDTGNCGSYSLFYIYARLNGVDSSDFNRPHNPVTDKKMREFREVCFRVDNKPGVGDMF